MPSQLGNLKQKPTPRFGEVVDFLCLISGGGRRTINPLPGFANLGKPRRGESVDASAY